jgi:MFS family permease
MAINDKSNSYFKKLVSILMLVQILDTVSTIFSGLIQSSISEEFLTGTPEQINSTLALANGIISIGMYFLFFTQYSTDKIGRKIMLGISVIGMTGAIIGMFFSVNFVMYMVFVFVMGFFASSDIWLIYINEESESNKRAKYSNIILIVGLLGAFILIVTRLIFIRGEPTDNWRGMSFFPMILGIPLIFLIFFMLKESSKYEKMKQDNNPTKRSFVQDVRALFQMGNRKEYICLVVIIFIRGISGGALGLFEKFMNDVYESSGGAQGLSQQQVTYVFLLTVFMVVIAYLVNGFLADRIGRKPLMYLWTALAPISALIWVFGAYAPSGTAFIIVLLGYSLSHISTWGFSGIIRLITIEQSPTDRRGTAVGFRSLVGSIGGTIGWFISSQVILYLALGWTMIIFVMGNFFIIPLGFFFLKETKDVELSEVK